MIFGQQDGKPEWLSIAHLVIIISTFQDPFAPPDFDLKGHSFQKNLLGLYFI
ncbi:MAG: hypothetical protein K8R74_06810 [Bacteroidales bacterium]|nr:hypothetical protein [Bacteroidales bacterium]